MFVQTVQSLLCALETQCDVGHVSVHRSLDCTVNRLHQLTSCLVLPYRQCGSACLTQSAQSAEAGERTTEHGVSQLEVAYVDWFGFVREIAWINSCHISASKQP